MIFPNLTAVSRRLFVLCGLVCVASACGSATQAQTLDEAKAAPSKAHFVVAVRSLRDAQPGVSYEGRDGEAITISDAVVAGSLESPQLIGGWRIPENAEEERQFPDGVPVKPEDDAADWRSYSVTMSNAELLAGTAPDRFELRIGVEGFTKVADVLADLESMDSVVAFVHAPYPGAADDRWSIAYDDQLLMEADSEGNLKFVWADPDNSDTWRGEASTVEELEAVLSA